MNKQNEQRNTRLDNVLMHIAPRISRCGEMLELLTKKAHEILNKGIPIKSEEELFLDNMDVVREKLIKSEEERQQLLVTVKHLRGQIDTLDLRLNKQLEENKKLSQQYQSAMNTHLKEIQTMKRTYQQDRQQLKTSFDLKQKLLKKERQDEQERAAKRLSEQQALVKRIQQQLTSSKQDVGLLLDAKSDLMKQNSKLKTTVEDKEKVIKNMEWQAEVLRSSQDRLIQFNESLKIELKGKNDQNRSHGSCIQTRPSQNGDLQKNKNRIITLEDVVRRLQSDIRQLRKEHSLTTTTNTQLELDKRRMEQVLEQQRRNMATQGSLISAQELEKGQSIKTITILEDKLGQLELQFSMQRKQLQKEQDTRGQCEANIVQLLTELGFVRVAEGKDKAMIRELEAWKKQQQPKCEEQKQKYIQLDQIYGNDMAYRTRLLQQAEAREQSLKDDNYELESKLECLHKLNACFKRQYDLLKDSYGQIEIQEQAIENDIEVHSLKVEEQENIHQEQTWISVQWNTIGSQIRDCLLLHEEDQTIPNGNNSTPFIGEVCGIVDLSPSV